MDNKVRSKDRRVLPRPPRIALMLDLEWPFKRHADLFAGTQRYANEHGWRSIVDEFVDDRPASSYDGVIARATRRLARWADHTGVPVINVWYSSPVRSALPGVFPDFQNIGRLRAEHLLDRGLRHFAALVREDRGEKVEAVAFGAAVTDAGFDCVTGRVPAHPARSRSTWKRTVRRIETCIRQWRLPIGVFAGNEVTGRMVIQVAADLGWRVPEDIAIVAGYNEQALCEHPRPSLSSVELNYERIGYEAARLLDERMGRPKRKKGRQTQPPEILIKPKGMVVRESSDFLSIDDADVAKALAFIIANIGRALSPDDIARHLSMEPRTLQRRFNRILGRPIAAEVRRMRIERAKRELAYNDRSLSAIARDVGFGHRRRMYEVFVRELGVTPSAYRKERKIQFGV